MLRVKKYYSIIGNDDKYSLLHNLVVPLHPVKNSICNENYKKEFPCCRNELCRMFGSR